MVDDEVNLLNAFKRLFRGDFKLTTALGAKEALVALETDGPFAVVISDMQMPEMNGIMFLTEVKKKYPNTIAIILSGSLNRQKFDANNYGDLIYKVIEKPCPSDIISQHIKEAIVLYNNVVK